MSSRLRHNIFIGLVFFLLIAGTTLAMKTCMQRIDNLRATREADRKNFYASPPYKIERTEQTVRLIDLHENETHQFARRTLVYIGTSNPSNPAIELTTLPGITVWLQTINGATFKIRVRSKEELATLRDELAPEFFVKE